MKFYIIPFLFCILLSACGPDNAESIKKDILKADLAEFFFFKEISDSFTLFERDTAIIHSMTTFFNSENIDLTNCKPTGRVVLYKDLMPVKDFSFGIEADCEGFAFHTGEESVARKLTPDGLAYFKQKLASGKIWVSQMQQMRPFGFLEGIWVLDGTDNTSFESWRHGESDWFEGMSYTLKNGTDTLYQERMKISIVNDQPVFEVNHDGKTWETFSAAMGAKLGDAVFTRTGEDWPQTIFYSFLDGNKLKAELSGKENGKDKKVEFFFSKKRVEHDISKDIEEAAKH